MVRGTASAILVIPFLAWIPHAMGAPKADGVAGAEEPPLCTDSASLKSLKRQYEGLEEQKEHLKVKEVADVKQLHFGPSPASVNQYANKTTYGTKSRYCQGTAMLVGGKTDTVYWRMDYIVEARGHSINFDHCSPKHNLLDTTCQTYRDGK